MSAHGPGLAAISGGSIKIGIAIGATRHKAILFTEHDTSLCTGERAAEQMAAVSSKYLQLSIAAGALVHSQFKLGGTSGHNHFCQGITGADRYRGIVVNVVDQQCIQCWDRATRSRAIDETNLRDRITGVSHTLGDSKQISGG